MTVIKYSQLAAYKAKHGAGALHGVYVQLIDPGYGDNAPAANRSFIPGNKVEDKLKMGFSVPSENG